MGVDLSESVNEYIVLDELHISFWDFPSSQFTCENHTSSGLKFVKSHLSDPGVADCNKMLLLNMFSLGCPCQVVHR